eukprot:COSAG01_NODE_2410_length_7747_cov_70.111140_1_plen_84_part_00
MTVPKYQFTSFGSVAEPIYLLPEVPSQFTSSARRLSVVAGVLSEMLLSRIWSLSVGARTCGHGHTPCQLFEFGVGVEQTRVGE